MARRFFFQFTIYVAVITGILLIDYTTYAAHQGTVYTENVNVYAYGTNPLLDTGRPSVYINTSFENASPLNWNIDDDGVIVIDLVYDHQRYSPNKSVSHRYFQLFARPGTDVNLRIRKPINIYKGRIAPTVSSKTVCYISEDGKNWRAIPTEVTKDTSLQFKLHMESESVYVSEIVPYSVGALVRFQSEIVQNRFVKITQIGKTVEGQSVEIVQIGSSDAPNSVFIRARAHAYESGGNWLIEGLVRRLLENRVEAEKFRKKYCLYVLPMANKDGVARGKSRYNSSGMDLNRNWGSLADSALAPENYYLELWIRDMIKKGIKPDLAIDLHNDGWGGLHISRPIGIDLENYLTQMEKLETLLHRNTWYQAGSTGPGFRDAGSMCEGLLARYGIIGVTIELNCLWVESLGKCPLGQDWELLGEQFANVFFEYFD